MNTEHISPAFSHFDFALLVLSTVLIAAAGYAINDYFDIRSDRINRPDKIVIGKHLSRRFAMLIHTIFNIVAVLIGTYLSYKVHSYKLAPIFIIISILLWLYSVKYKSYFLVGNIIVAFVSAFTIIIVWLFDMYALRLSGQAIIANYRLLNFFLWAYISYSFATSLIREIIKDIEDFEGDAKCGCSTLPVVMGVSKTKYVLIGIITIVIASLVYIDIIIYPLHFAIIFWYILLLLVLPFVYMIYVVIIAKDKSDYSFLSNISKFIMIAGAASMALTFSLF
ncbi:MAG TPA: geranylgeranylglycerol-phosphate geranylgeranyltransferase [Bacteroidales bacterium]|nr:geranylgeranylglycerol-phosphate geranylgeranyltransferase [Bacteroidales bacterium]HPS17859.1 geranylgeranylglycerol-phosphate geranylgeranyltransferase [Bacteroidales bacterium]